MAHFKWHLLFVLLPGLILFLGMTGGCDSGKQAVDELTGNRAVKQFHKSKEDMDKIAGRQSEKFGRMTDEEK